MIWNTPLNRPLRTSREVRRIILDHNLEAGWPVKWGHHWDIAIGNELVPTGLRSLDWTGQQWIDFITKQNTNKNKTMKTKEKLTPEFLEQFNGSEECYRVSPVTKLKMTEGIKYLADEGQCWWLITDAAPVIDHVKVVNEAYKDGGIVIKVCNNTDPKKVEHYDMDKKLLYTQEYPGGMDFPFDEYEFWCMNEMFLLKSEY